MKITSFGAAGEVTGTKHLLEINGRHILLDCGMFQGHREEADQKNRHLGLPVDRIDAVILSHAHIDHSGLLPLLIKQGYRGPIYSTAATRDLGYTAAVGLEDGLRELVAWRRGHLDEVARKRDLAAGEQRRTLELEEPVAAEAGAE